MSTTPPLPPAGWHDDPSNAESLSAPQSSPSSQPLPPSDPGTSVQDSYSGRPEARAKPHWKSVLYLSSIGFILLLVVIAAVANGK